MAWSPDGETIAAVVENVEGGSGSASLTGVDFRTGTEMPLTVGRWEKISHIAWLPDGNRLALTGSGQAESNEQIWLTSSSSTRKLTADLNDYSSVSLVNNGKELLTTVKTTETSLVVAMVDRTTAKVEGDNVLSETGTIGNVIFGSNGDLIYSSRKTGTNEIWTVRADGTNPRQLSTEAYAIDRGLAISLDAKFIVYPSGKAGGSQLWRINADGSNPVQLTDGKQDAYPSISPDGREVYFQRGLTVTSATVWKVSIDGKNSAPVSNVQGIRPVLSPDGKTIAYYFMKDANEISTWRIGLISTETDQLAVDLALPKPTAARVLRWTKDSKSLTNVYYVGEDIEIISQPRGPGPIQDLTGLGKGEVSSFDWSPDNQRLVLAEINEIQDIALIKDSSQP
ncbi:MAG: DPP IV N-terminal domain-containing protein [Acidobacteriota bacterium]